MSLMSFFFKFSSLPTMFREKRLERDQEDGNINNNSNNNSNNSNNNQREENLGRVLDNTVSPRVISLR